jgi:hypothetical protein
VSGCSAASSACDVVSGGGPPPPLSVSIAWNGASPYIASGASGVCSSYTDGGGFHPNVLVPSASGGTPPYTDSFTLFNDPSGKLSLAASPDTIHTTIAWTGFSVNENQSCNVDYTVTDSLGVTQTGTCGPIRIRRDT